jgi:hypothetical protein
MNTPIPSHTPGKIDDSDAITPALPLRDAGISGNIWDNDNVAIARVMDGPTRRFIVRAVNSHDELVSMLEAAANRVELANAEGDQILSAWLVDARALLSHLSA